MFRSCRFPRNKDLEQCYTPHTHSLKVFPWDFCRCCLIASLERFVFFNSIRKIETTHSRASERALAHKAYIDIVDVGPPSPPPQYTQKKRKKKLSQRHTRRLHPNRKLVRNSFSLAAMATATALDACCRRKLFSSISPNGIVMVVGNTIKLEFHKFYHTCRVQTHRQTDRWITTRISRMGNEMRKYLRKYKIYEITATTKKAIASIRSSRIEFAIPKQSNKWRNRDYTLKLNRNTQCTQTHRALKWMIFWTECNTNVATIYIHNLFLNFSNSIIT